MFRDGGDRGGGGVACRGGWRGDEERGINKLREERFTFVLRGGARLAVVIEVAEGAAEEVVDVSVGAVVGALGGGVAGEEAHGEGEVAVVEFAGPIEVAGAEDGEIDGPHAAADDFDDEGAGGGIGIRLGEAVAVLDGGGLVFRGHALAPGFVAPAVSVLGALGGRGDWS